MKNHIKQQRFERLKKRLAAPPVRPPVVRVRLVGSDKFIVFESVECLEAGCFRRLVLPSPGVPYIELERLR